jgi:hypothetical protein
MSKSGSIAIFCLCCGMAGHVVGEGDSRRDLRARIQQLEAQTRSQAVRLQAIEQVPYANIYDLNLIGMRTKCLRDTLETLVSTWPGRAKLPEPCGAWPVWPRPGESLAETIQP